MPPTAKNPGVLAMAMRDRSLLVTLAILAVQAAAALYFLFDGVEDIILQLQGGVSLEVAMEMLVAAALLAGVSLGALHFRRLLREARRRDEALAVARGALGELIGLRFSGWGLSAAEADVALFALKGFSIAEIAKLRKSATGTVRSQLSQVYAKAGVSSQSTLIALFIDDLLEIGAG